jgi:hypothetical protein
VANSCGLSIVSLHVKRSADCHTGHWPTVRRAHGDPLQDLGGRHNCHVRRDMKMASGNWSVVNRTLNAKSSAENFSFDILVLQGRSGLAPGFLISREVLRALQHGRPA